MVRMERVYSNLADIKYGRMEENQSHSVLKRDIEFAENECRKYRGWKNTTLQRNGDEKCIC